MTSLNVFNLFISTKEIQKKLANIDIQRKEVDKAVIKSERLAHKSIMRNLSSVRMLWGVAQGVIRASGGSITMTTRLLVSSGLGAIQTLLPLIKVGGILGFLTSDPTKIAAAALGLLELTTAIAALAAFESQEKQISLQLRGANFAIQNVSNMLYAWV